MKTAFVQGIAGRGHGRSLFGVKSPSRWSCYTLLEMSALEMSAQVAELSHACGCRRQRPPQRWLGAALLIAVVAMGSSCATARAQGYEVPDVAVLDDAGAVVSDADFAESDEASPWQDTLQWEEDGTAQPEDTAQWEEDEMAEREETVQWEEADAAEVQLPVEGGMMVEGDFIMEGGGAAGYGPVDCDMPDVGAMFCDVPRWAHRNRLFGEFLYLRPRDVDVVYALPVDGPVTPPGNPANPGNQIGRAAIVDPGFQPAFRFGFERAWDASSGVVATYTRFESTTSNAVAATPGNFIQSQVTHPGVLNAEDNWLEGAATLDVDFTLIDVDYRWLISSGDGHAVNLRVGARYAQLNQDFHSRFAINGARDVATRLEFEGGGLRLGFDAERFAPCSGWMVYGRGNASFVAGDFRGDYTQGSSFAATEIDTAWKAGRIVTMLDLELGVGWTGPCDRVRLRAGYLISGWLNAVQTDQWIDAVNANQFSGLGGDAVTFDGFTAAAEYRF